MCVPLPSLPVLSAPSNMAETEVRELGHGQFGKAVLVKRGNEHLVLKKISMASMDERTRGLQLQEAKLLKELQHPNIVFYKGCEQRGDTLHLYMEYCEGGDLLQLIRARGTTLLPEATVTPWVRQLASALQYIHSKRVLHRDLKPNNVFLSRDKSSVKLGDFGLAKILSSESFVANTMLGTLLYMAPEVFRGMAYDDKADMYSLGACIFHLTALTYPQPGIEVPVHYSAGLRRLITSLRSENPRNRPTAEAVLGDAALGPPPAQVTIIVHDIDGMVTPLKVIPASTTVARVKEEIHRLRGIDQSAIAVTFKSQTLKDNHTLAHYQVKHGDNLRLILTYVGGACGVSEGGGVRA